MRSQHIMSLLEPTPEPSHKYKALTYTAFTLLFALLTVLYLTFRYYPEKERRHISWMRWWRAYQSGVPIMEAFGELQDRRFSGGLGAGRLLRTGKELRHREGHGAQRRERSDFDDSSKSVFAVADKSDVEKSRRTKQLNVWVIGR